MIESTECQGIRRRSSSDGGEEYYNEVVELARSLGIEGKVVFSATARMCPP